MFLTTESEMIGRIQNRLDSRDWYLIIGASPMGQDLACCIEEEFYTGKASKDFEALMIPCQGEGMPMVFSLYLAKKKHMPIKKFLEFTGAEAMGGSSPMEDRDVLGTPDMPLEVWKWLEKNFRFK